MLTIQTIITNNSHNDNTNNTKSNYIACIRNNDNVASNNNNTNLTYIINGLTSVLIAIRSNDTEGCLSPG